MILKLITPLLSYDGILALVGSFLCLWIIKVYIAGRRSRLLLDELPGPQSWPFIGNLNLFVDFKTRPNEKAYYVLKKLSIEYERLGLFKLKFGPKTFVFLTSHRTVKALLESPNFRRGPEWGLLKSFVGEGLATSNGIKWQVHRKLLMPAFHYKFVDQFIPVIGSHSRALADKITNNPQVDNVFKLIGSTILGIGLETIVGLEQSDQLDKERFSENLHKWFGLFGQRLNNPFLLYGPFHRLTSNYRQSSKVIASMNQITSGFINKIKEEKVANKVNNRKPCMLDFILDIHLDKETAQYMTTQDVQDHTNSMIFGGHDTTTAAITNTLYFIAKHEDVQEKLRNEVESAFADTEELTKQSIKELTFLEAVVKEALRLIPVGPIISRQLDEDLQILDKTIPKDTVVFMFAPGVQERPEIFEDPQKFSPERWLDKARMPVAYSNLPFSAGPRMCPGRYSAMNMVLIIIAQLIKDFDLELSNKKELSFVLSLILEPTEPIRILFKPRK